MWAGQADELRFRSDQGGEAVQVDLVAGVEGELEVGDIGVDRPGRLEVASVVGAGDDEAIAGTEQGGRGQEEGAGRTDCDEDVVRGQGAAAVGGDLRSEGFAAAVVAVAEQEVAEGGWIEADVGQGAVAHRAFGEVDADAVVADLLGALDLHDHALVVHSFPSSAQARTPMPSIPIAGGSTCRLVMVTPAKGVMPQRDCRISAAPL